MIVQKLHLEKRFPGSKATTARDQQLTWEHTLTPSSLSNSYRVRVSYVRPGRIDVNVIEPKLALATGKTSLPHVFSHAEQRLCLFRFKKFEWNANQLIVDTIVPWTCEWLLHYEIWLITGEWLGGGEHLEPDSSESRIAEEEGNNFEKQTILKQKR